MPITKQELRALLAREREDRVIHEISAAVKGLTDQFYHNKIILLSADWATVLRAEYFGLLVEKEVVQAKTAVRNNLLALIDKLPLENGVPGRKTTFFAEAPPQLPERIFPRVHLTDGIREAFRQKPFVLLHGPSGIGKTRLAEMYFQDFLQDYDHAGWFKVDNSFVTSFYLKADQHKVPAIADTFHTYKNIYQRPIPEVEAACARVFSNYLEQECPGRKLLVVDGVTHFAEEIEPHLDLLRLTDTHVLICTHTTTSDSLRVKDAFPHEVVEVGPFTEEELEQMVLFYNPNPAFSEVFKHPMLKNPLLAGVFLKNSPGDHPDDVRKIIDDLQKTAPGEDYNHRLLTALFRWFDLAPAMKWVMLQYAAMPDIPREPDLVARLLQLKSVAGPVYTNGYNIFKGKYRHDDDPVVHFDQILDWLSVRGWLVVDENGEHYLHRAFVPVLREQCKPKFDYFLEMAENLELKFFLDENDWEEDDQEVDNSRLKRLSEDDYERHLGALFSLIQEEGSDDYIGLLYKYADLLHVRFEWDKEISLRERAVMVIGNKEGEESERFLNALDDLGMLFYKAGLYSKCLDCYLKEMSIKEKILSPLELATSYNNVGSTYGALGDHKRALEYEEKALGILEQALPPLHPDLAKSYNNIGNIYGDLGDYKRALDYNEKALGIMERTLPPLHPELANSYSNVGVTYGVLGDHKRALEYVEKALEIRKQALPPLHPDLASSYNIVGGAYRAMGDTKRALEYVEKALEIREQALPPLHPDLATSYSDVGSTYGVLGDHKRTLEYVEKALEIREQALPPLHPDLATSYSDVGSTYGVLGDHKRALEYKEKALEIMEQALPPLHPDLARSYNNVGSTYGVLGDHKRALEYVEKALEIMEQALPPLHPDLATSYGNVGFTYAKLHRFPEARAAFEEYEKISPDGYASRNWSMYHALQNHTAEALENLQKAVDNGCDDLEWITTDDSLDSIRNEPAYHRIVEQLRQKKAAEG